MDQAATRLQRFLENDGQDQVSPTDYCNRFTASAQAVALADLFEQIRPSLNSCWLFEMHKFAQHLWDQVAKLEALSLEQLDELHYDCETTYAGLLLKSEKGSSIRGRLYTEAYELLACILAEGRRRRGIDLDAMGFTMNSIPAIEAAAGSPPSRVLDVGCSSGVLVEALLEHGYDAEGIDVSDQLIRAGKERLGGAYADALHRADFMRWGERPDGYYNLIHSNDVLEHIHPDESIDFLQKCFQASPAWRPNDAYHSKPAGPGQATQRFFVIPEVRNRRGCI